MIINTNLLAKALKALKPIISTRPTHRVLGCYYLELSGDRLIIRASDLTNSAETSIGVTRGIESDRYPVSSVCIPAFWGDENKRWFCDFIAQIGKDSAELTLDFAEELLKIKFDRSDYEFNGIRGREFIAFPEVGIPIATVKTSKTAFIEKFKAVLACVSNDKSKQVLTGVHLLKQGTDLRLETCDGHSMAVDWLPSEIAGELNAIVNQDFIDAIAKFETDSENIEIEFYREVCRIQMGDLTIYSRLIDATYPDIAKFMIMPDRFVQFKPKDLVKQLRTVRGADKKNKKHYCVWLSVNKKELVAEGLNGIGKISAKVPEEIDLTKAYARLDSDYLLPILSKLGKDATIALSPNKVAVMRSESGTYFALMPITTINARPVPVQDGKAEPLPAIAEVPSEPIAPPEIESVPQTAIATSKNKPLPIKTKIKRLVVKKERLEKQIANSTNNKNLRKWAYELTVIEAKIEQLTPQPTVNNDEIKSDIINLSSGVLASCCSQAGVKCTNYGKLDRVRDAWLNWLSLQSKEFKRWQQCWIDFADEISLASIIDSGEKDRAIHIRANRL